MSITVSEIEKASLIEAMRKRHFVATNSYWELRYILPDGTILCDDKDKSNMGHQAMASSDELIGICNKHKIPLSYDSLGVGRALNEIAGIQHIFVQRDRCFLSVMGGNPPNLKQMQGLVALYENIPADERKDLHILTPDKSPVIKRDKVTLDSLRQACKNIGFVEGRAV